MNKFFVYLCAAWNTFIVLPLSIVWEHISKNGFFKDVFCFLFILLYCVAAIVLAIAACFIPLIAAGIGIFWYVYGDKTITKREMTILGLSSILYFVFLYPAYSFISSLNQTPDSNHIWYIDLIAGNPLALASGVGVSCILVATFISIRDAFMKVAPIFKENVEICSKK